MIEVGRLKIKKGEIVQHKGRTWFVEKILIPGIVKKRVKAYIQACPIYKGQKLFRSSKTIGNDWR